MFKHIMVPVETLRHEGQLDRALGVAADLAGHYGARVTYVGVTVPQPSSVAHTPQEFAEKLAHFRRRAGRDTGASRRPQAIRSSPMTRPSTSTSSFWPPPRS